ncbi:unnamed protein product [Rhizophagus irregularis]|nr:unnamed protein product [Rhizophagus irregularis]CAB4443936.1 unnamed protein product [Rhizophagus irregularis]
MEEENKKLKEQRRELKNKLEAKEAEYLECKNEMVRRFSSHCCVANFYLLVTLSITVGTLSPVLDLPTIV